MGSLDLGNIAIYFGIFASAITILTFFYIVVSRIIQLEFRVTTMWDFLMKRGKSELVMMGAGAMNSPIRVNEEAKTWITGELKDQLITLGKKSTHLTENQLAMEIEHKFGDRILKEVCIPRGMYMGACLYIALAVVEEAMAE